MTFAVLYVCTGNVCRSPAAELLLRHRAAPGSGVVVSSAGLAALEGSGVDDSSAQAVRELGADPGWHRARQFETGMAEHADLILTAERAHRDATMNEVPGVFRRTFTMKEFTRLSTRAAAGGPATPREVVERMAELRGVDGAVPEQADSVADPYHADLARARVVVAQVAATVQAVIDVLGFGAAPLLLRRPLPYPR